MTPPWNQLIMIAGPPGDVVWFVANVYETLVDVPQLLIDAQLRRRSGLLAPGAFSVAVAVSGYLIRTVNVGVADRRR